MNSHRGSLIRQMGRIVLAVVCLLLPSACLAQGIVDCVIQGRVRTPFVRGIVVDPTGAPVPDTPVILEANGNIVQQTKTDAGGNFNANVPSGTYRFKTMHPQFTGVAIDLVVGRDFSNAFGQSKLYGVLGLPGSFCPMVWTSANKFHRMVDANKKHLEESAENHATQK